MNSKILLTGAFGNVGQNTLRELLKHEYNVRCFDLKNKANKKASEELLKTRDFEIVWGDLLKRNDIETALEGINCIIHLAAIIPPISEKKPDLAYKVNVEGTQNLIKASKSLSNKPRFIMASSVSVYGVTMHLEPPVNLKTPLNPSDNYSRTKVECENILKQSGLPWLILRLGAVSVDGLSDNADMSILYEVPLNQRIEFVSSRDCGIAFTNAVSIDESNRIFLIGGGDECQLTQREFLKGFFDAFGLKMLPDKAFKKAETKEDWLYIDWMDTQESQKVLKYQTEPFQQWVKRLKQEYRFRRLGMKILSPLVNLYLLNKSPYC
jgi:nucleoside-diphosphate-sugar epimerase